MSALNYLEDVILGRNTGVLSWLIRALLGPFSLVYRIGLAAYLAVYAVGLRKRHRLGVPVISVGNLTLGGTGKTPAVQTICRTLADRGSRVAVLSRGHGGSARGPLIVSDGSSIKVDSRAAGDEPVLLGMTLPGVSVIVGKDRRKSGELACREFDPDVIVLDDGFQYWQLERDLDVIVLDAARPFGSGFLMPMGDLREPAAGLRRAGVVLVSNSGAIEADGYRRLEKRISALASNADVFRCSHQPVCIVRASNGETFDLGWLKNRRIVAFCGIARPSSFIEMLESYGASLEKTVVFPDHHVYTVKDLADIENERGSVETDAVVTTEKDLARLGTRAGDITDLYALRIRLEIEEHSRLADRIYSSYKATFSEQAAD